MVPDVQAVSVKEWPAPTALTRRPSAAAVLTARTRSSSVVGRATVAGTHCWLPAQFRHRLRADRVRLAVWESLTGREPKPLPGCGLSRPGSAARAPPPGLGRTAAGSAPRPERLDEPGHHLVHVSDYAQVGDGEDGGLAVLVDGDDVLGSLHPHHVLGGAGDAAGDVHGGFDGFAGLADLVGVGDPAGVDDGARGPGRGPQELGQLLDHLVLGGLPEAPAPGDDDGGLVQLGPRPLLNVTLQDAGRVGGTRVGRLHLYDLGGAPSAGLGRERLRSHHEDVGWLA